MPDIGASELVPLVLVYGATFGLLLAVPLARLSQRAGYTGWLGLLGLTPVTAIVLVWILAFAPWRARGERAPTGEGARSPG